MSKGELFHVLLRLYFIVCSVILICYKVIIWAHTDIQTNADSNTKFLVRASFLEIYNERISDLLVRIVVAMHACIARSEKHDVTVI